MDGCYNGYLFMWRPFLRFDSAFGQGSIDKSEDKDMEQRKVTITGKQKGMIQVWNKGKCRLIILPKLLRQKLCVYAKKYGIGTGAIFRTRTGKEKNRSNIWKEMKAIAKRAGVSPDKVFPHNLRHLFARTFYRETKNLLNLADLLGHSNLEVTRIYASQGISEWQRNVERVNLLEKTT